MFSVALTGNVAAGKTAVARLFGGWGATVIDADAIVHELQQPGTPVWDAILARFGRDVLGADGSLDRGRLRSRVLHDAAARNDLNAIVHPAVRRRSIALLNEAEERGDCIVVSEIPLLFEAADPAAFDAIVFVDAPIALRRERLIRDRALSPDEADRLMAAQAPAAGKRARSHYVIDNDGTLEQLAAAARGPWLALRRRAATKDVAGLDGPIVVWFATPVGAAATTGGTTARYAETGIRTVVVLHEAPRDDVFPHVGALLGWDSMVIGESVRDVADRLRALRPGVVAVEDGPDGPNCRAARGAARAALLCWPAPSDAGAAISIDVRPWRGERDAALAQLGGTVAGLDRERFGTDAGPTPPAAEFSRPRRDVDSLGVDG